MNLPTIISASSPSFSPVALRTRANHQAYADAHGYGYVHQEWEDGELSWAKPGLILEILESDPRIPRVIWIDSDAVFTNMDTPIPETSGVTMSCDVNGLCAGVMLLENTVEVRALLYAVSTSGPQLFPENPWSDQMALRFFLAGPPYDRLLKLRHQRAMNSYWPGAYSYPGAEKGHWQEGDWILHLPGLSHERRIEILTSVLDSQTGSLPAGSTESCSSGLNPCDQHPALS